MSNDSLHESAVKLLLARTATTSEVASKGAVKSYNLRRREATAKLQDVLTKIFACLARGESVGGYTSKETWASSQSITIRQIQRIIAGPKPQAKRPQSTDVALIAGMTVLIDGLKLVLTEGNLASLKGEAIHIATNLADKKKYAGPTAAETKAVNKELRARAKGPKVCTKCKVTLPAELLAIRPFAKLCTRCREAQGDVPTHKGQQITTGKSDYFVEVLPVGVEPQNGSLLRNN
jgi:RNA polymerase-binding transcription factor DksA